MMALEITFKISYLHPNGTHDSNLSELSFDRMLYYTQYGFKRNGLRETVLKFLEILRNEYWNFQG